MVEAMFERTPGLFCQFGKQYLYFICQREPKCDHTVTKKFCLQLAYEG